METANLTPRPRSQSSHSLNFMPLLLAPYKVLSIVPGELDSLAWRYPMKKMKTVGDIRHINLLQLLQKHGSLANLNEALGLARTDATLSQIKNQSLTSRGKPKMMGVTLARRMETVLGLPPGYMDNEHLPASYRQQRIDHAVKAMEHMEDWQVDQAIKIIDTIAESHPKAAGGR